MVSSLYQVVSKDDKERLREMLVENEAVLMPIVGLIEESALAVDWLIDLLGQVTLEAVVELSAQKIAGPRQQGKEKKSGLVWHGSQEGSVGLADRRLRIRKVRLRKKEGAQSAEVPIPAYETLKEGRMARHLMDVLLRGISTRDYVNVIPTMAETTGVSRSSVSREVAEAMGEELRRLCERRFDDVDLLAIYVDGVRQGDHVVVVALGVDSEGKKHVLGVREGATENAEVVKGLLEDLVARGVNPGRKRLWVIDGSKALRKAIDEVYGEGNAVQRCRTHKVRNVMEHLPKELQEPVGAAMRAAYKLGAEEGIQRLKKQAEWLEKEHPSAAASLREGLDESFTVNRLGLPGKLRRCLSSTNVIENPNSGLRRKTGRVSRWRDGEMVLRWTASSLLACEKGFRRIMGHRDLWMLDAALRGEALDRKEATA